MSMNNDISAQLSAYMAPIPDDGFSDDVMAELKAQAPASPLPAFETDIARSSRWAGPIISLCLGGAAALIWNALIGPIALPETALSAVNLDGIVEALNASWLYLGVAMMAVIAWLASDIISMG
jgi:hypothetical protein